MLSIILYGRNDDHGYNYHKRLALSLNCLAEVLTDPQDEILFVDYNSPNELPPVIQAIQDTLTSKAKSRIRTFRVRPQQHLQFAKKSSLPLLEPVARNIAIRRSCPDNRWILSTNVDILILPEKYESLTEIVSRLDDGFYILPRFELPENFWESALDRLNPQWNIHFLRDQYRKLHLNSIIRKDGFIKYDNPGDFQLMLRKDIFELNGFDEEMLKGWHVDSNLCKRMALLGRTGVSLENELSIFHCNHTQKESFLHSKKRTENDWNRFVDQATLFQREEWGLSQEAIEEVSLLPHTNTHFAAVNLCLKNYPERGYDFLHHRGSFNKLTYCTSRIFTFLVDHLCHIPKTANIAYIGYNPEIVNLMAGYLEKTGITGNILCLHSFLEAPLPRSTFFSNVEELTTQAFLFIFDFGFEETTSIGKAIEYSHEGYVDGKNKAKKVMHSFFKVLRQKRNIPVHTKFIGINTNNTDFNPVFNQHISIRLNCYITGISYGYFPLKTQKKKVLPSKAALKKKILLSLHYFVVRYLFNYSDWIRKNIRKKNRLQNPSAMKK